MLIKRVLQAKSSFVVLQALDLVTTLIVLHFGGFEANPLVGRLIALLGPTGGVLAGKVFAVFISLRLRKLLWVANLFYVCIIFWNTFVLLALYGVPRLAHSWM